MLYLYTPWKRQHSVHLAPFWWVGGRTSNQILNFYLGVAGKEGRCNFFIKNQLKPEIFNDKKVYKQKHFSLS